MRLAATLLALGACGAEPPASSPGGGAAPAASSVTNAAHADAPGATAPGLAAGSDRAERDGRSGELLNPDEATMVFLYHALAGVAAPLDLWVERDARVAFAGGAGKAARRDQVRAEMTAALAAVKDTGFIRLTLNDQLSDYDSTYEEFTLRALAPSSTVAYKALQQEVTLRFGNGRNAQVWSVPAAQAQAVQDSFRHGRDVVLDLLLKITSVQPATGGGAIVADVVEYEIRTRQGNQLLGRVNPPPQ